MKKIFVTVAAIVLLTACADRANLSPFPTIDPSAQARIDAKVNCSTAHRDIMILEEERASVGKQVLSGVRMVMPVSVVAGILMGDYRDRVSVAAGDYNSDIDAKIALIKKQCGIQ